MRARSPRKTYWTWLLMSVVASQAAQFSPCDNGAKGDCVWSSEYVTAATRRRDTLDALLAELGDRQRFRSHIGPRFAAYEASAASYDPGRTRGYERRTQSNQRARPQFRPPSFSSWDQFGPDSGSGDAAITDHPSMAQGRYQPAVDPALTSDNKRARYSFSSWGGKRLPAPRFNVINAKRRPAFSSWGGKRAKQFFNWGGKRGGGSNGVPDEQLDRMAAEAATVATENENGDGDGERRVLVKRQIGDQGADNGGLSQSSEPSATSRDHNRAAKRLCVGDAVDLRQLLDEFVEWSRKQPEQKKASLYTKMLNVRTLHSPDNLSRRAGSFYPWGGKRNSKWKDV